VVEIQELALKKGAVLPMTALIAWEAIRYIDYYWNSTQNFSN
jgi:hypothetical protein